MIKMKKIFALCLLGSMSLASYAKDWEKQLPYQNPKLSVEERVEDLIGRMTLEEKLYQMSAIYLERMSKFLMRPVSIPWTKSVNSSVRTE